MQEAATSDTPKYNFVDITVAEKMIEQKLGNITSAKFEKVTNNLMYEISKICESILVKEYSYLSAHTYL